MSKIQKVVAEIQKPIKDLKIAAERRFRTDRPKDNCKHLGEDGYCTYWRWESWRNDRDLRKGEDGKWNQLASYTEILSVFVNDATAFLFKSDVKVWKVDFESDEVEEFLNL